MGQLAVTDGSTEVQPTTLIYFASGATVTDLGGGEAQIDIAAGSTSSYASYYTPYSGVHAVGSRGSYISDLISGGGGPNTWNVFSDPDSIFDPATNKVTADGFYDFYVCATVPYGSSIGTNPTYQILLWPQTMIYESNTIPVDLDIASSSYASGGAISLGGWQLATDISSYTNL